MKSTTGWNGFCQCQRRKANSASQGNGFLGSGCDWKESSLLEELLNTYCRIHGSLKVEWRTWNDNEYREFLATIDQLRSALALINPDREF